MSLKIQATESGGFELHPADEWIDGTIQDIEETEGQWGLGLKFIIHLDGDTADNGDPWETWAFASQKLSPRSKLYSWVKGLDPDAIPEPGEVLDLEQFIGTRVQAMFEQYEGTDPDGNSVTKEKVAKLRKGKGKAKKAAKAKKPVEDEADDAPF